jgi:type IV pilus assembly protein PilE
MHTRSTRSHSPNRRQRGFTVIELLIVLMIIGILFALAVPQYKRYVIQARRVDGQAGLLETASLLQKYYTTCGQYPVGIGGVGSTTDCTTTFLGGPTTSPEFYYSLAYAPIAFKAIPNQGYTLKAVPDPAKSQATDTECATLTLTDTGIKGTTGIGKAEHCWRQ